MTIDLNTNIYTIVLFSSTLLVIGVCLFFIGYLIGQKRNESGVLNNRPKSFFDENKNIVNSISIDNKKYVGDIKTSGLERKYNSLGDTKTSQENISSSIDKLKNMKG